ncbi:MAG: energy transducer TonB [Cyclobacteriaceae bacterium]
MEKRKNPQLDIYRHSGLFFQIGLLITLLMVVSAFEWRSRPDEGQIEISNWQGWEPDPVKLVKLPEPKPPKPRKIPKPVAVKDDVHIKPDDIDWNMDEIELDNPEPPLPDMPPEEIIEEVDIADKMPVPEGGYEAFYTYIMQEMEYPSQARKRQVEGKVFISFLVDEFGNMTEIKIAKGIGSGCDEEVLRVLKNAPKWKPGWKDNKLVRVRMILPVAFRLD